MKPVSIPASRFPLTSTENKNITESNTQISENHSTFIWGRVTLIFTLAVKVFYVFLCLMIYSTFIIVSGNGEDC